MSGVCWHPTWDGRGLLATPEGEVKEVEVTVKLRVFERGSGETLACGSGACAAVAIGQIQGKLSKDVRVDLPGGSLRIRWPGPDNVLKMTGPAEHVYDGTINL